MHRPLTDPLTDARLRLFAFATAEGRHRYLAILRAFESAREQNALQLSPDDVAAALGEPADEILGPLDALHGWGLLDRMQDDSRVRTIAEYRRRRSVYAMTELGWLAWSKVEEVLSAAPGEAELRQLVLASVLEDLVALEAAVRAADAPRTALLLDRLHTTLAELASRAARFALATSELSTAWEADPALFLAHKQRLLRHLDDFLGALARHRPLLSAAVRRVEAAGVDAMLDLAASESGALDGPAEVRARLSLHWGGIAAWFLGAPERPARAEALEERTSRAIRDLAGLLRRVLEVTSGGVSRATDLELLAGWFVACPDDESAHALAGATLGLTGCRHFGLPEDDPEAVAPSTSWWDAPPVPVDTTLRKRGRASPPPPPSPIRDVHKEVAVLRGRQEADRRAEAASEAHVAEAIGLGRPLDDREVEVLLRLLSRALSTRRAASATTPGAEAGATTRGRLRLTLRHAEHDTSVPTSGGTLVLPRMRLEVHTSARPS